MQLQAIQTKIYEVVFTICKHFIPLQNESIGKTYNTLLH